MAQIPNMNWMGDQPTGSAYDVYQYYLGGGSPGGTSTPSTGGGISSLPWYQQTGGGGDFKGGGRYGNLDLSKTKDFTKNVWSDTTAAGKPIGPPGQFDWISKDVKGYYDPNQGNWKTLAGKNINHAGINIQPMFASLLGLDKKGPKPGDIEGTFTKGWESGKDKIKEGWEDEKDKWSKIFGSKKKKAKKEKEFKEYQAAVLLAAQEKEAARQESLRAQVQRQAAANKAAGTGGYQSSFGGDAGFMEGSGTSADMGSFQEGGMVNDPEYRGWKKMYEANPEIGSLHEKHPTFIKFYKKYERDQKKFGGLAGLLYG